MKSEYLQAAETQISWLEWIESYAGRKSFGEASVRPIAYRHYQQSLKQGDLYYVGPEFCDLLEHAVASMPDVTFNMSMFPSLSGFVLFHRPIQLEEIRINPGKPLYMAALGWHGGLQEDRVMQVLNFGETANLDDFAPWVPPNRPHEPFYPATYFAIHEGDSVDQRIDEFEEAMATGNRVRSYPKEWIDPGDAGGLYIKREKHEIRYLMALLLLLNQKILGKQAHRLERATRRRAQKAGRDFDNMQVITLRRYASNHGEVVEHEPGSVNWKCQWAVRGHWRQQWYASTGRHEPKFILPYLKGPEGLPFKAQSTVSVVVR